MLFDFSSLDPQILKKQVNRMYTKLNISPKYRKHVRNELMRNYLKIGKIWNEAVLDKNLEQDDRSMLITISSMTSKFLSLIDRIEENIRHHKVKKRRFSLYVHKVKKKVLIELRFFHIRENTNKKASLIIFKKRGRNKKPGGIRYYRRVSKKGYLLVDSGRYFRRVPRFNRARLTFKGKKRRIVILMQYATFKCCNFSLLDTENFPL